MAATKRGNVAPVGLASDESKKTVRKAVRKAVSKAVMVVLCVRKAAVSSEQQHRGGRLSRSRLQRGLLTVWSEMLLTVFRGTCSDMQHSLQLQQGLSIGTAAVSSLRGYALQLQPLWRTPTAAVCRECALTCSIAYSCSRDCPQGLQLLSSDLQHAVVELPADRHPVGGEGQRSGFRPAPAHTPGALSNGEE